ncbi:MAG: carotenoid 1,2-hydratase [Candidatus Eremiobacteraeota bacterium]|nr:carotenoid 1,2-hydratase [Candidatus Eremiobacteraeota bacterium]
MSKLAALVLAVTFTIARAPYRYDFPRDHFAHDTYRTEWWYYTGHLQTADGRRFGYELTFFRFALIPNSRVIRAGQSAWRAAQLYPAHFAITDESAQRFSFDERLGREALNQAGSSQSRLDVGVNDWTLREIPAASGFTMQIHAASGPRALDLVLRPLKPPAIHGEGGVSRKGPCTSCASHYYSFTRIATSGTLVESGRRYAVSGVSWMDHEFGSGELTPEQTGWDWFSMQFADGRDVMLYRLRQRDGTVTPQSSGSVVERNGRVAPFSFSRVSLTEKAYWTSPHTGARYPSEWIVGVPGFAHAIHIVPALADQELIDPGGALTYWEGAVNLYDAGTGRVIGAGYVELTGYANASGISI